MYIIAIFIVFISYFSFPNQASMTTYYIDTTTGTNCANDGLATTTPFCDIDTFADNARSPGDIAFVRRGIATTTAATSDVTFTSDGTLNNPITISSDYDNLWGTFATSTQTYTPVFGSTVMNSSASTTGIVAGDWVYVYGDCYERYGQQASAPAGTIRANPCEFAYEVASLTSTTITLHLPYKGNQSGSGHSFRVMGRNPQWNITSGDFQFAMSSDNGWYMQGLDIAGTDSVCNMTMSGSNGGAIKDIILRTNGSSSCGLAHIGNDWLVKKIRFLGGTTFISISITNNTVEDSLIDCNSAGSSSYNATGGISSVYYLNNVKIVNCSNDFVAPAVGNTSRNGKIVANNLTGVRTYTLTGGAYFDIWISDKESVVDSNFYTNTRISSNTLATTTTKDTANLRAGGGASNLVVFPPSGTTDVGVSTNIFPASAIKLFEYPIYTDTSSKTYTMYFKSTSTAQFITDPLTAVAYGSSTPELFIECEYYAESSGADRQLKRSNTANDVDFNGSTDWQDISVTCQPTQTGILFLRGWYAKPSDGYNAFYMDTTPTIQ